MALDSFFLRNIYFRQLMMLGICLKLMDGLKGRLSACVICTYPEDIHAFPKGHDLSFTRSWSLSRAFWSCLF